MIEEEDFDSGEGTAADLNGHGTQVGGLVVYGDIARRMQGNEWLPQVNLYSAKVLRNDPNSLDPTSRTPHSQSRSGWKTNLDGRSSISTGSIIAAYSTSRSGIWIDFIPEDDSCRGRKFSMSCPEGWIL